ncbi:MAG: hypothetical protein NWT08_08255 [Akkermansiaceae bacterium]|jgi:hypothetical protein|nr:hypothetical protein [Akkermansiaceae bacterium]MDP4647937.1 hypothetical protein [Akkermansiaceae bacterium]MDP4719727.1 hypothetical protein [Akkermansiaceae bacterium]MDP4781282.1 hypothetical protein [Akkermansiaceae bacterium]MDP4846038.1 hypothetical protein [Akkermansiaceae bacterium]
MKKSIILLAAYGILGSALVQGQNCEDVAASVTAAASAEDANLPEIVDEKVSESPNCVCEIVKAAIAASEAEDQAFGDIVEAAGNAAPEKLQLIVDCVSTVASEGDLPFIESAATSVQNSNPGLNNPLNFPGIGPEAPIDGMDGGNGIVNPDSPCIVPPIIENGPVTDPNTNSNN